MEKGAKIVALISILAASPAAADLIYVSCDLPLARLAPIPSHLHHPLHRHHRHRHPVGKRGRVGLHFAIWRGMCPLFVGEVLLPLPEELGGPSGFEAFGGGDWPIEDASSDFGADAGGFDGGGFGGGGLGSDIGPLLSLSAPFIASLFPSGSVVPIILPPAVPVPEPSTWLLILAGFAAIVLKGKRRWLPILSLGS